MRLGFIACITLLAALVGSQCCAVVFVDQNAPGPAHDGTTWDTAYLTIQQGVSAATPGGEVWVADGLYNETVVMGTNVAMYGGFLGAEVSGYEADRSQRNVGANVAIIDGANFSAPCVTMADGAVVDGFTVTGGSGLLVSGLTYGGGFYCQNATQGATIANNKINDNSADHGGGIYCTGSTLALSGNTLSTNYALVEGGAFKCVNSTLNVALGVYTDNWADQTGGIVAENCHITIDGPYIATNTAATFGGAIVCRQGSLTLTRGFLSGNDGGGILVSDGCNLSISGGTGVIGNYGPGITATDAVVSIVGAMSVNNPGGGVILTRTTGRVANCAFASNGPGDGGGLYFADSVLEIASNNIPNNQTNLSGGGICGVNSTATLTGNTTDANRAPSGFGGGMYFEGCDCVLERNNCNGNQATAGVGVYCIDSNIVLDGNNVKGNQTSLGDGGGIGCVDSSVIAVDNIVAFCTAANGGGISAANCEPLFIVNNTLYQNTANADGGGIYIDGPPSTIINNIGIYNGASAGLGGGIAATAATHTIASNDWWSNAPADYSGCGPGVGDISVDPQLVDPTGNPNNFRLSAGSLCIDAGLNAAPQIPYKDFEGDPRVCDGTGDGVAIVDMGADEYRTATESTKSPSNWFVPGWVWFSIPLIPEGSSDGSDVLGFACRNRLYEWDDARKSIYLYPNDFTDLVVGRSYLTRLELSEQYDSIYVGTQPQLPFEWTLPSAGWCWVGVPATQDINMSDLLVRKEGVVRTPTEDRAAADPWVSWNWIYWDPVARSAKIAGQFGGADDTQVHPWYGYRVWMNTADVTIIFP